jgi:molybdate transport system substrate-binding protein
MKKIILILLMTKSFLLAGVLNVALAANVSYAIDELKKSFHQKYPDIKISLTIGGSGKLSAQIQNGAPYDIFMSANMLYPQRLYQKKLALNKPRIYAEGALAMVSVKREDFSRGIALVTADNIKRIAIANPKTAPYGKATIEALKNAKLYTRVQKKFIYAESIAQTLSYTMHAAELGFIAKSALYSPKLHYLKENENWITVPTELYHPIAQGIVILEHAHNNPDAKKFYDFILSDEAKVIFKKYGYSVI